MAKKIAILTEKGIEKKVSKKEYAGENIEEIERMPIYEGLTEARIIYNHNTHEYLYTAVEPEIDDKTREAIEYIKNVLRITLEYRKTDGSIEERRKSLESNIEKILQQRGVKLDPKTKKKAIYYVVRDYVGFGKIDILMNDPLVEDISCDGSGVPIFVAHRAYESIKTNLQFDTDEELDSFVISLAQMSGKQISIAEPMVDGTLLDGSRLQATLAREITTRGSSFTIRRFRKEPLTPTDLIRYHTISPEMMAYLWLAVEFGESIVTSGGTASGKTSTMNAMLLFIPPQMKIISIEDTREINIPHENWIAGLTRSGFGGKTGAGSGEVSMFDLIRAALRQRPQYIVVGEVRGKEAFILFQAMATGHTTYSTIHADSVRSIVHRLENPPISLPRVLLAALNIVVLQSQVMLGDRVVRRINKIVELVGLDTDTNDLITNTVYEWEPAGDEFKYLGHSVLFDKIMNKKNLTKSEMDEEFQRRTDIIKWMYKKNVRNFRDVAKVISSYYVSPEEIVQNARKELSEMNKNEKN